MRYRRKYTNKYLSISVDTNSSRVYKLVDNFLDFKKSRDSGPRIKMDFRVDEISDKRPDVNDGPIHRSRIGRDGALLSSGDNRIATVVIDPGRGMVRGTVLNFQEPYKEYILDFLLMQPLRRILARHRLFFLHVSAVCKDGDCILISGPQNSGKSTLALTLARNRFDLLTDDDCFIRSAKRGIRLFPFPTKMGLNDAAVKRYPELHKYALKDYRYGGKRRLSLGSFYPKADRTEDYRCKMVIFPKYKAHAETAIKKIPGKGALDRLFYNDLTSYTRADIENMFWALYNITQDAGYFELTYNDAGLDKIPGIVHKAFMKVPR
ncbi:MAG: hypothetical protein WC515_02625 [Candidatus Omnitrophota bacterium]